MNSSLISVIIPTFNRSELLREALLAIFAKQSGAFECVVVDDGSEDDTLSMIESLRQEAGEDQLVSVRQPSQSGAQIARNRGIDEASGDFILFMDSDDVPRPEGILALREKLEEDQSLDYIYGWVEKTDCLLNPLKPKETVGAPFDNKPHEIAGYHWHTMGALYRRSCVQSVGPWNVALTGSQDWEYQARVKVFKAKGKFIDTLVGYWRQHDGFRVGTSKFRPDYVRSVMLACESILSKAKAANLSDAALEKRIAKRLIVHAFEWGANGYKDERRRCFQMAANYLEESPNLAKTLRIASNLPEMADAPLHRFLAYRRR